MLQVIIFSLLGGIVSLTGGLLLLTRRTPAKRLAKYSLPFAAGALIAAAFFDLIRDGAEESSVDEVTLGCVIGVAGFFILERFLHWFHHHHQHADHHEDPTAWLVIIGDTLHNAIDGIAIAAAFMAGGPTGMVTTLAVAAHEIPQEIGDFSLLLSKGVPRRKVLLFNILSALATTASAVLFYWLGGRFDLPLGLFLGITAGFFIYIASSDIIPTIHEQHSRQRLLDVSAALFIGAIVLVGVASHFAHRYIYEEPEVHGSQIHTTSIPANAPASHSLKVETKGADCPPGNNDINCMNCICYHQPPPAVPPGNHPHLLQ